VSQDTRPTTDTTRRGALAGFGLAGLAAATLTACGGSSGGSSAGGTPSGGTGGSAGASSPGQAGGGSALASTSEIPVGGGKVFSSAQVVVTQPSANQFKAFSAVCTHEQCLVDRVANGTIDCPCHGSEFSVKDGSVVSGPAPSPLPAKSISVSNGKITLA
jgi:nitrite reductase/ring-hydroxylating ferredoxin subunit